MSKNKKSNKQIIEVDMNDEIKKSKLIDSHESSDKIIEETDKIIEETDEKKEEPSDEPLALETRKTTCLVNMRKEPSKSSEVLKVLEKDTKLEGGEWDDEWFRILFVVEEMAPGVIKKVPVDAYIMTEFLEKE